MQLSSFLKVPVVYFFEDYPAIQNNNTNPNSSNDQTEDLNYSFLAKLFSSLSELQKEKIFEVLKNTRNLEKNTRNFEKKTG